MLEPYIQQDRGRRIARYHEQERILDSRRGVTVPTIGFLGSSTDLTIQGYKIRTYAYSFTMGRKARGRSLLPKVLLT